MSEFAKIENVSGKIDRRALGVEYLDHYPHASIERAEQAARAAIANGYERVLIQCVRATRLQEGLSMDDDDHWVDAPGKDFFVLVDNATWEQKNNEAKERAAARQQAIIAEYATALAAFEASPHAGYIATGTALRESMTVAGFGELVDLAYSLRKLDELRLVVAARNQMARATVK